MDEIKFKDYTVTCKTNGCMNKDIPITLPAPEINPNFVCGPCGQSITDIV